MFDVNLTLVLEYTHALHSHIHSVIQPYNKPNNSLIPPLNNLLTPHLPLRLHRSKLAFHTMQYARHRPLQTIELQVTTRREQTCGLRRLPLNLLLPLALLLLLPPLILLPLLRLSLSLPLPLSLSLYLPLYLPLSLSLYLLPLLLLKDEL